MAVSQTSNEQEPNSAQYRDHNQVEIETLYQELLQKGLLSDLPSSQDSVPQQHLLTVHEAIGLHLADKCSLGRAAELAGVSRWHLIDVCQAEDVPLYHDDTTTPDEFEGMMALIEAEYAHHQ